MYESIREAARQNNVSKTAILNVLNKRRNSANNCYWAYEEYEFLIPIDRGNEGSRRKSVTIKKENQSLTFDSISESARYLEVSRSALRRKTVKGYLVELNL